MSAVVFSQFGNLLIQANYDKEYGRGPEADAASKNLISTIFLIGNIIQVPLSLYIGHLCDGKRKVWALLTVCNFLSICFAVPFMIFIDTNNVGLVLGFVGLSTFRFTIYMLCLTMLSKIVKPESRGTLYGVFGVSGSIGVLLINKIGGILFDGYSHSWPFGICVGA